MRKILLALAAAAILGAIGCSAKIPADTAYVATNPVRYEHNNPVAIGRFIYIPMRTRGLQPNQIQNTAIGNIYAPWPIADKVREITALELKQSGMRVENSAVFAVAGEILELKADDLGYSVNWTYAIRYQILRKATNAVVFSREYQTPVAKTAKGGIPLERVAAFIHQMMHDGYALFISDADVRKILDDPV